MPAVGGDVSGEVPSVDAKLTTPDVKVEGGDVDLSAGLAAGAAAAVGAIGAGMGLSGKADMPAAEVDVSAPKVDVDAALPSVSGDVGVDVPSVEIKKPKKGIFGGIGRSFKKSYSKGKIEVNNASLSVSLIVMLRSGRHVDVSAHYVMTHTRLVLRAVAACCDCRCRA